MIEINLKEIGKFYGANHILKSVSFEVKKGDRIGLIGRNGTGKSTLFKIITGLESYDSGIRTVRKDAVIGMLDQIPEYPGSGVLDVLYSAYEDVHEIHKQMLCLEDLMAGGKHTDSDIKKYGKLQQDFEALNGYELEDNIKRVCNGLQIDTQMCSKKFEALSGGEKTRVMLGKLILQEPDIILLDEPTNHLDIDSIEWLESFLEDYRGSAVVISHDRYFLDKTVNRIVEIEEGKAENYEGNYSFYVREKEVRYNSRLQKYEQEQKKAKQLEAAAKRMHEWAKRADNPAMHKRAFSIEKRIERMEKTDKPVKVKNMDTVFCEKTFSGKELVICRGISKSFDSKIVLDRLDFIMRSKESVGILGQNGCGKSTFMKCITGDLKPDTGNINIGDSVKYAYLSQIVEFENPELSVMDTVRNSLMISEEKARKILAGYKFTGADILKAVKSLSGGEKSRLRFCMLMQEEVNLLLLDEPTNHLDIYAREWLENALAEFSGAMMFVSHDRYFINKFASRIAEFSEGKVYDYYGDYEYYKFKKKERDKEAKNGSIKIKEPDGKKKAERKKEKCSNESGDEYENVEMLIEEREERLKRVLSEMDRNASDYEKLGALCEEKAELEGEIEKLYQVWSKKIDLPGE